MPRNTTDLRGFLGTTGCGRKWIKGYSLIAKPLTSLLRGPETDFAFTEEARQAMETLKRLVTEAPVLISIDYQLAANVSPHAPWESDHGLLVTAVDALKYGASWVVFQIIVANKKPAVFGSCTYNEMESQYSQPKCELYGLFRVLKDLHH